MNQRKHKPRILIVECNTQASREAVGALGGNSGSALYRELLQSCRISCDTDILIPDAKKSTLPHAVGMEDYDGIVWTGSSMRLWQLEPAARLQLDLLRHVFSLGIPSFGSCWAAQLGAVCAGGDCQENPAGSEIGFARNITLTAEGRNHPLYAGKRFAFSAIAIHNDIVTRLPPDGICLAGNDLSKIQALSIRYENGNMWCVQYHPEFNLHEIACLLKLRQESLIKQGFYLNADGVDEHVRILQTLHSDPMRKDLAWRIGIDQDVLDCRMRWAEIGNWLEFQVLPTMN